MNIAYQGVFLREGLQLLGHNIIELSVCDNEDIHTKLERVDCDVGFVLIELFSHKKIPTNLYKCKHTLVAYCIDSPLNEFWLLYLCKVFDYVFVDQKSSVQQLRKSGIDSTWLPLCAQSAYFREYNDNRKYDIVFVGVRSEHRIKRNNLLFLLKKHFSVNVFQNIPSSEMIDLFSQSKIVLNENLFSGLTLRVFQGLASHSVLLTEKHADGVDDYFDDGKHIVCYDHGNILHTCEKILANYESYKEIAYNGYRACRERHTSEVRAMELLSSIEKKSPHAKRTTTASRCFFETKAHYLLKIRFGGYLGGVIQNFTSIASADGAKSSQSLFELGNIAARANNVDKAESLYLDVISKEKSIYTYLKLACVYLQKNNIQKAKSAVAHALLAVPREDALRFKTLVPLLQQSTEPFELFVIIAHCYSFCDKIFSPGFLKQSDDKYPDTAFEAAFLAWNLQPSPVIMDYLLSCAQAYHVEVDLLPVLIDAIKNNWLSDKQILQTAEIARKNYDTSLAEQIISSFKKAAPG